MTLLIKNACVFTGGIFKLLDVLIKENKIFSLGTSISSNGVHRIFNAQNKYLLIPGFVDVHVHLRQPGFSYKETIKTGTMAAAKAGYTAVCSMPNLNPPPDTPEHLAIETDIIKKDAIIDVYPFASITKGRAGTGSLVDFASFSDSVIGFSDDGSGVQDEELMREAMKKCATLGKILSAHCEVNDLLYGGYIHDGEYCRAHGHIGISSESEWKMIERDCRLAEETGCQYHVCHISTKESVEIIRAAKSKGVRVTCETAPHYLVLDDSDLKEDGSFKMNPPIRSKRDKEALLEGVLDGTIDVIATDHAPHSIEEKGGGLKNSAMGIVGLETAFPVLNTKLVKTGIITIEKLIDLMSVRPRQIFEIDGGDIKEGVCADLALLDTDKSFALNPEKFVSMGRATPFDGWQLQGENRLTIKKGEIIYENM